MITPRANYFAA